MDYMIEALKEAQIALEEGEVPVGAVVVKDGRIIGRGHNKRERELDISGHAEISAMKEAAKQLGRWALDGCAVYVTLEPCLMCAGAIKQARVRSLHCAAKDERYGAESAYHLFSSKDAYASPLVYFGEEEEKSASLLNRFFANQRNGENK